MKSFNIESTVVSAVLAAITVYSEKGRTDQTENRKSYGLSLCLGGRITYIQNGVEYISEEGAAVILPKGQSYTIKRERTGLFPVINFDCAEPICDTVTVIKTENESQLLSIFKKIEALFCYPKNEMRIFSLFYEMLHLLASDGIPYTLKKALKLINEEYQSPTLTNERLAAECGVSTVYFRKLFTKHLGTSPKQFIIDLRIQRAKQLLCENSLGISEISERCGFSNPYHFSRIFKEREGTSAMEYRNNNRLRII